MKLTCEATSTFSCLDCQHKAPAKLYWPLYQARCDHVHRRYSQESPRISIYIGFHSLVYSRLYNGCKLFGGVEFLCRSRSIKVMNNEPETVGSASNTAGNIIAKQNRLAENAIVFGVWIFCIICVTLVVSPPTELMGSTGAPRCGHPCQGPLVGTKRWLGSFWS